MLIIIILYSLTVFQLYQVIFIPYNFFENEANREEFQSYFKDKIAYWAIDHPSFGEKFWRILLSVRDKIGATMYIMTKEQFMLSDHKFTRIEGNHQLHSTVSKKYVLKNDDEKINWLISNLNLLTGQGIIYCNAPNKCKAISKQLRKKVLAYSIKTYLFLVCDNQNKL